LQAQSDFAAPAERNVESAADAERKMVPARARDAVERGRKMRPAEERLGEWNDPCIYDPERYFEESSN
jgi:hypothetical protein